MRTLRMAIVLGALLAWAGLAAAAGGGPDVFGYTWTDLAPYHWLDASNGTQLLLQDDVLAGPFEIGFPFDFYGTTYEQFYVGSNGRIVFVQQPETFHTPCIPSEAPYVGYIALYWDDLDPGSGGLIYTKVIGDEPNRYLIVEYNAVPLWSGAGDTLTAEAVLSEQTGDILLQYQNPSTEAGLNATVGLMSHDGVDGLPVLCRQGIIPVASSLLIQHPGFLSLTAADQAAAAPAGQTATYALAARNVTGVTTVIVLSLEGNAWSTTIAPDSLNLEPGETGLAQVTVTVPADAAWWDRDPLTVRAYDESDPTIAATVVLVTTAGPDWQVYSDLLPEPFQDQAVVGDGEWIYLLSNYEAPGISGTFIRFNLDGQVESLPDLEPAHNVTDGACLWHKLVFPGGLDADGQITDALFTFDIAAGEWLADYQLPVPTAQAAAVVLNEKLYVIGGFDGEHALDDVYVFYPGSATWHRRPSLLERRAQPNAGVVDGRIVVVGGYDGAYRDSAEMYDPQTGQWTMITPPPLEMPDSADCTCNGKLYLLGGQNDGAALDFVYEYDPVLDVWTPVSSLQTGRFATEADLLAGRIVTAGGMKELFVPTADAEALDLQCAAEVDDRTDDFGDRPDLDGDDDEGDDDTSPDGDGDHGDDDDNDEGCCGC